MAWLLPTAIVLLYLSGGFQPLLQLAVFVGFVVFPAAALLCHLPTFRCMEPGERVAAAATLVVILALPIYYLRRAMPINQLVFDAGLCVLLTASAVWCGAYREWLLDLKESTTGPFRLLPLLFLPVVFALSWAGFAVTSNDQVHFSGLFPVDFCNLAGCVSLVKVSPALPLDRVAGTGAIHYHWLFFPFAAWLSEFMAGDMPAGNALILANYLSAGILLLVAAQFVKIYAPGAAVRWIVAASVAIVVFAPLINYPLLAATKLLGCQSLLSEGRNTLVLSVVNSIVTFGNNTLAIGMILSVLMLVNRWNASGKTGVGVLLCVFLVMLPGYSVTLTFTVALAILAWFLLGRVRFPLRAVAIALPIGLAGTAVLHQLNILGGDVDTKVVLDFDNGRWLVLFCLFAAPLCYWAVVSMKGRLRLTLPAVVVIAGLIVPSLLRTEGSYTTESGFSMKTSTLLFIMFLPWVAEGLHRAFCTPWRHRWLRWPGIALVLLGLLNSSAYLGQYVACRLTGYGHSGTALPLDYCRALAHLRQASPPSAIILDSTKMAFDGLNPWPVLLAERRVYLPNRVLLEEYRTRFPEIEDRSTDFRSWQESGFRNAGCSEHHAALVDYILIPDDQIPDQDLNWARVAQFGRFHVYRSQIRESAAR